MNHPYSEQGSGSPCPPGTLAAGSTTHHITQDPSREYRGNTEPAYTPPFTFDDPDLINFQLNDGPYLDIFIDRVYFALIRFTDPESFWAFPSIDDICEISKMKPTSVRKHLAILCDPDGLDKFHKVDRSSADNGSQSNGYFLNAGQSGLVPNPMTKPCDDPLAEALRIMGRQRMDALRAEKDWDIGVRDLHIEQLKAQLEVAGVAPVSPAEPGDPPSRGSPPSRGPPSFADGTARRRTIETSTSGWRTTGNASGAEESKTLSGTGIMSGQTRRL